METKKTNSEKLDLIKRNLQEIVGSEKLEQIINEGRSLKLYWGTATTGKPHIAYFVPITKLADFLSAGCQVTILLADLHAYLDNVKAPWELLEYRVTYYKEIITAMLQSINVPIDKLKFVRGTEYQMSREYTMDVYKLCTLATEHDCKKAGSDVVKQTESPCMSGLLYPGLQALDEEYLNVDAQFGGVDQRKIFMFAEKYMPKLGYEKRIHLMNPMVPGLSGAKMSSSEIDSKIDLLDSSDLLRSKIKKAFCEEGNIENNGVLSFCEHVFFPVMNHHPHLKEFVIERSEKNGGTLVYKTFSELKSDFSLKKLHPQDLKLATFKFLDLLLVPIRERFKQPKLLEITKIAYPSAEKIFPSKIAKKDELISPSILDLRVAQVIKVTKHSVIPDHYNFELSLDQSKSTIYTACAKILDHKAVEQISSLVGKLVVTLMNIKPSSFKGFDVNSKVLCCEKSVDAQNFITFPLYAPEGCKIGDNVFFEGYSSSLDSLPILNPKKKEFETICAQIKIDSLGHPTYNSSKLVCNNGEKLITTFSNIKIF